MTTIQQQASDRILKSFYGDFNKSNKEEYVVKEDLKEMIKEHEKLVDVLDSESHLDDKKESIVQKKELSKYKEKLKRMDERI